MLYPVEAGAGLARALEDLCRKASRAIADDCTIIILSDRGVDKDYAPIPALLATSCIHHYLIREGTRMRAGLVIESGEPREVHHAALLISYGAGAVNPYLAFETLDDMIRKSLLPELECKKAVRNYIKALNKGVLKVISKMGISTIQSYRGAQIFEAVGLSREFVNKYFTWTTSRIGGVGIDVIAEEVSLRHYHGFPDRPVGRPDLESGGEYQWRRDGEYHLFNPETISKLQYSTRTGQYDIFKEYSALVDRQNQHLCTLRGLFEFRFPDQPIPIDEVEPVESILKRFATGAMSYGSISREAHETLAIAMNRMGARSNTGEGGEDPARYKPDANGDCRRSAVKQVASGRFGVTSEYLVNSTDLQIKMAQGSKPGEGGQLPGPKVYPWIAKVRYSTPGVGLISPPPHHDIYSIEDIAQLIHDLKNSNPNARVHVKLVAEVGVGTVAAGVAKARSDVVLISGQDGGTGASALSSIKHAGLPWELGVAETQQVLVMNNLRDRITVQTDGQMKTGRDVVIAALLGAEEYGFSTAPLVVLGCVMMRACHLNTCPVGVATQDPELRKKFTGKPEFVENFFRFIAQEVRELMAGLGFRSMDEMIGRVDHLDMRRAVDHWKARGLDCSSILYRPEAGPDVATRKVREQDHGLEQALDRTTIIPLCRSALEQREPVSLRLPIRNVNGRSAPSSVMRLPTATVSTDCPTTRSGLLYRVGRAKFRCLYAPGNHPHPGGGFQRLPGQGYVGWKYNCFPSPGIPLLPRGEHPRGKRGSLRRNQRRGLFQRGGRRTIRGPEQRRPGGGGGRRRPRLRVHDRRSRRRHRLHRAKFRRGHVRRRCLRSGRGRRLKGPLQSGHG
jgi:glutamate synthase (ferredoxin)